VVGRWNAFSERVDRLRRSRSTFSQNFFEPAMDEFFRRRRSKLCAQQTFRRHDDERFDKVALHLAPQHMKVLSGSGEIADLNIILWGRLQKAVEARAGVFRALAFIAMREQEHNSAGPLPLRFR